jgi:hypothetical protein
MGKKKGNSSSSQFKLGKLGGCEALLYEFREGSQCPAPDLTLRNLPARRSRIPCALRRQPSTRHFSIFGGASRTSQSTLLFASALSRWFQARPSID